MGQAAAALGATVVGSWSDMAGHAIYLVVDAPDAHAVNQLAADIRLMDWSTVDINPIVELTEAVDRIGKREAFL